MGEADHIVLERWKTRRDAEAFQELVTRYSAMVYATCKRVLGNAADAEDAVQECFEALAQARSAPGAYLGPWLHSIAVRQSLNRRRGETARAISGRNNYLRDHEVNAYASTYGEARSMSTTHYILTPREVRLCNPDPTTHQCGIIRISRIRDNTY